MNARNFSEEPQLSPKKGNILSKQVDIIENASFVMRFLWAAGIFMVVLHGSNGSSLRVKFNLGFPVFHMKVVYERHCSWLHPPTLREFLRFASSFEFVVSSGWLCLWRSWHWSWSWLSRISNCKVLKAQYVDIDDSLKEKHLRQNLYMKPCALKKSTRGTNICLEAWALEVVQENINCYCAKLITAGLYDNEI